MLHFIPPTAAGLLISKVFGPTVDKPSSGVQRAELSRVILAQFAKNLKSSKAGLLGGTSMAMALSACGGGRSDSGNGAVDEPLNISSEATGTRLFSFDTLTENADVALSSANAVDLQTSNIQNLNITTTDGASILKSLSGDSLETVTIAGDQDVTIENFADATNPNIDIDASELKGDLQAVLSSRGNSNVVGGIGDDVITILGNFNSGIYSDNEQINALANNASLEISDVFGDAGIDLSQFDLVRSAEGVFSLGDGNDKVISFGALSSNGLTLEGVETLEIHSLFTTNSFFLKHWGGNEIIFAGSQDHTLRIQIVEDIATGEYITDIDLSMINVAQGNLNIEIYGPPGITLDADYDVSEVNVINPSSSQVEVEVFDGNRELLVEPNDIIFNTGEVLFLEENQAIGHNITEFVFTAPRYTADIVNVNPDGTTNYTWNYMELFIDPWDTSDFNSFETQVYLDLLTTNIRHAQYSVDLPTLEQYSDSFTIENFYHPHVVGLYTDMEMVILRSDGLDYEAQQEHTISLYNFKTDSSFFTDFGLLETFHFGHFGSPDSSEFNVADLTSSELQAFSDLYLNREAQPFGDIFDEILLIEVPIVVLNVDEVAPIITSADVVSIADNSEVGATIYTVTSTDNEDISEGVDYSITAGSENFSVDEETGAVTVNSTLEAGEYTFTVKATDGENNSTDRDGVETSQHIKTITVKVTETDTTPPTIANIGPITLAENTPLQTTVATVTASDEGGAVTYSLDESSPNIFAIDSLSGVITLTAGLDYETDQQYSITVVATDPAGNEAQSPISIIVGNIDEAAPTIAAGNTTISISEDTLAGSTVSIALTTNDDDDVVDGETASLTYSLVGENRSNFVIDEDTGGVAIGSAGLDFETTPEYSLKVRVTDQAGNINFTDIVNINVTETETETDTTPPIISNISSITLAENAPLQTTVATVTASDDGGAVTYSLDESSPNIFAIDSLSGVITLTAGLDYETDQQYSITVVATDPAGNEAQSPIRINVSNVDEAAPTIVAGNTTISISEDTVAGSTVSIALTTNDDDEVLDGETASLTYSLVGENRSDFVINEETGGVSIGTAGLDFETTPEYSLQVRVTDQAENISETDVIQIIVIDTDEGQPVITSLSTGTLTSPVPAANVTNAIYTITADDSDNTANELTYSISNNPGSIRVDSATGEIFLNASPGFPVSFDMDEITFDATVADPGGLFDTLSITIDILSADTGGWG